MNMKEARVIPQDIVAQYRHRRPIIFLPSTGMLVFLTADVSYTAEIVGGYFNLFDVLRANHDQEEDGVKAGDIIGFQFYLPPIQSDLSLAQKKKFGRFYSFFRAIQNALPFGVSLHTLFLYAERVYPGIKTCPFNKDFQAMIRTYPTRVRVPLV